MHFELATPKGKLKDKSIHSKCMPCICHAITTMMATANLVFSILAHHKRENAFLKTPRGIFPIITSIHEHIVFPAMTMKVTVDHHFSFGKQPMGSSN